MAHRRRLSVQEPMQQMITPMDTRDKNYTQKTVLAEPLTALLITARF